jgi:hypothetical protein
MAGELKIVGTGPDEAPAIWQDRRRVSRGADDVSLRQMYRRARALILPAEKTSDPPVETGVRPAGDALAVGGV